MILWSVSLGLGYRVCSAVLTCSMRIYFADRQDEGCFGHASGSFSLLYFFHSFLSLSRSVPFCVSFCISYLTRSLQPPPPPPPPQPLPHITSLHMMISSPLLGWQIWHAVTGKNYHDFSLVFTGDNRDGWAKLMQRLDEKERTCHQAANVTACMQFRRTRRLLCRR